MKWLLLTTVARTAKVLGSNPGDEFARIGIEGLIKKVDPGAEFDRLDKERTKDWDKKHEFDRFVICGMPMLWSTPEQTCNEIYWWEYVWNSYVTGERRNVLPLGIGHVLVGQPNNARKYTQALREVTKKSWKVVSREPIFDQPRSWIYSVCPSAFCMLDKHHYRNRKLCNFMPRGGHFGHLTDAGKRWEDHQAPEISKVLMDEGFDFIAHSHQEVTLSKKLGWPEDRVMIFNSAQEYLDLYQDVEFYLGNRMHGAAVCAATGAPTWGITHDSRLGMVKRLGGKATTPHNIKPVEIQKWIRNANPSVPLAEYAPRAQQQKMLELLKEFAFGT